MNRFDLYDIVLVDNVPVLDFLCPALSAYAPEVSAYHKTTGEDVGQPDLVSFKAMSDCYKWWLVMLVNQIHDPFFGIQPGAVLKIPDMIDVNRLRRVVESRRLVEIPQSEPVPRQEVPSETRFIVNPSSQSASELPAVRTSTYADLPDPPRLLLPY